MINCQSQIQKISCSFVFLLCLLVLPAQLLADGKSLFSRHCASCHTISGSTDSLAGPDLLGVVGRAAGTLPGFNYSAAMIEQGEGGLIWTPESLERYLESPRQSVPGTTMGLAGIASASERQELIQWMGSENAQREGGDMAAEIDPALKARIDGILALSADPDYGEYLAGECLTCHSGAATGAVPQIRQLPAAYFVRSLLEYQSGQRSNAVMQLMAKNLGDDEIAALSAFFTQSQ